MNDQNRSGGLVILAVGGAALLWWLWGRGGKGAGRGGTGRAGVGAEQRKCVNVNIIPEELGGILVDGATADLATAVEKVRAAGKSYVTPRGDTRDGWVQTVLTALRATHASLYLREPSVSTDPVVNPTWWVKIQ